MALHLSRSPDSNPRSGADESITRSNVATRNRDRVLFSCNESKRNQSGREAILPKEGHPKGRKRRRALTDVVSQSPSHPPMGSGSNDANVSLRKGWAPVKKRGTGSLRDQFDSRLALTTNSPLQREGLVKSEGEASREVKTGRLRAFLTTCGKGVFLPSRRLATTRTSKRRKPSERVVQTSGAVLRPTR